MRGYDVRRLSCNDDVVLQELLTGELTLWHSPLPEGHMTEPSQSDKPDLRNGIADGDLADGGMLVGQVGDEQVLLARRGGEVFAIGATCTHYGGPLGEGLMVADTLRCPWHHACFSLRTGEH